MFESLLKRLAAELNQRQVPYMIIGGQAVLRYGEPRLTKDIDVTVGLSPDEAHLVLDAIEELEFQVLVEDVAAFLQQTFVLPAVDPKSGIRIDFIFSLSEYERGAIGRASDVLLGGIAVRFISLEDLLIYKIVAGRPRDVDDARSIILKNPGYNCQEVRRWLQEYDAALGEGFEERLNTLLRAIGSG